MLGREDHKTWPIRQAHGNILINRDGRRAKHGGTFPSKCSTTTVIQFAYHELHLYELFIHYAIGTCTAMTLKYQQSIEYDSPFPNDQLGIGMVYGSAFARVILSWACATATPSRPCRLLLRHAHKGRIAHERQGFKLGTNTLAS